MRKKPHPRWKSFADLSLDLLVPGGVEEPRPSEPPPVTPGRSADDDLCDRIDRRYRLVARARGGLND